MLIVDKFFVLTENRCSVDFSAYLYLATLVLTISNLTSTRLSPSCPYRFFKGFT